MQGLLPNSAVSPIPTWTVHDERRISPVARANWRASGLDSLRVPCEEWESDASNRALRYATHGLFRYFGKFPPILARYLIEEYTRRGETVLDPMIGCGTTAIEALLLGRHAVGMDVHPLSLLLSRVKCRRVDAAGARHSLASMMQRIARRHTRTEPCSGDWPMGVRVEHWFLPETCHWLHLLRDGIRRIGEEAERELFLVAFASIIRRVSRATTEQGRLFLDVATAEPDPRALFEAAAHSAIAATAALPDPDFRLTLFDGSCKTHDFASWQVPFVICHPPYFNLYRYSAINALEAAWLGHDIPSIRKNEIREFFKVGKPENVARYVDDMQMSLRNVAGALRPGGTLVLMIGDTAIHGKRVPTARLVTTAVSDVLVPVKVTIRQPRFTEASWAASQRRTGGKVGVTMTDFLIHFRRRR
jgi:hypothetical protein